jgi:hypothetical protein
MRIVLIVGRFLLEARERAKMMYGVTNKRVLIISGIFSTRIKSINLRTVSNISLDERSSGAGTISFGASPFPAWWSNSRALPGVPSPIPTFELAQDARAVFEMIRSAQESELNAPKQSR